MVERVSPVYPSVEAWRRRMPRRSFLKLGAGAALAGMAAGAGAPLARAAGARRPGRQDKPLTFVGWQYHPEIVEENVKTFEDLYNEQVDYQLVPGEYPAVVETKMIGGERFDMMYAEEDRPYRWYKAGWIRPIEDLPGVPEMKQLLYPSNINDLSLPDGRLAGLPYYSGHNAFVYNEMLTSQLPNWKPPETWEELMEQAKEFKAKGISEYPYLSAWGRQWASLSWSIFAIWYSEGEPVFDKDFNPTFEDGGVAFKKVLEWHKSMYDQQLTPPDTMTLPEEALPTFATGRHVFMVLHDYDQKYMNDPKLSKLAGHCKNALMPGKTHETFIWTAMYLMGKEPVSVDRAWNLMQFFGGKAKDGKYHVAKRWALEFGLGTGWKEVVEDPEVVQAWTQWRDLEITKQQIATSRGRDVSKSLWFAEWDWFMMGTVQDYIAGKISIGDTIKALYDKAVQLKKQYPA